MKKFFIFVFVMMVSVSASWGWEEAELDVDEALQLLIPDSFRFEQYPESCFKVEVLVHGEEGTESNPTQIKKKTRWKEAKSFSRDMYYEGVYRFSPEGVCRMRIRLTSPSVGGFIGSDFTLDDVTFLMRGGHRAQELLPAGSSTKPYLRMYSASENINLLDFAKRQPKMVGIFMPDFSGHISEYIPREKIGEETIGIGYPYVVVFPPW
ncbi:MAG: hypothetical protein UW95_C0001G0063 [Parcubacteria group bacterium GW2011_GWC1_45_14]|nr:MAG: hypothetical protein UW87_C0007G0023 [Candidatus Moranbacteria bacterium GW2011_GWC2_45_10]KKT95499.1 MAG: hypothetical protein UW95_C0001G0063 [Parcubacteria group bacterium GW2011_GWC1_45_14]